MKIGVLGLGNFGTALAAHLSEKHENVLAWSQEEDVVNSVNTQNKNIRYLSHINLSPNLKATTDLNEMGQEDFLVVALPAVALQDVFPKLILSKNTVLVSATKGIDHKSGLTPLSSAKIHFGENRHYAVLSGPGFAKDLASGKPAALVSASEDLNIAQKVAEIFTHRNFRVYISNDPIGVELGGILKNVIAIATGISDGLNLGDSARAALVTRGFAEMLRLSLAMGAKTETLMGLSGMGDLVLTATCDSSRNRTLGLKLGQGESLSDIIKNLGSIAEGASSAELVVRLAKKHGVEMPIAEQVHAVLKNEITPMEMLKNLLNRPLKKEF
jgi:glycerol-3-phosphate dehydrogenase (NAD(P)+)